MVLHIAGCKHARQAGLRGKALEPTSGHDVAILHVDLAFEDVRVGLVADGHKTPFERQVGGGLSLGGADPHACDTAGVAQHFVQGMPQVQLHLACLDLGHELVDHDGLGAKLVPAVNQVHLGGDVGQVQRLFDGRIASADDAHFLVFVEETIASGAAAHTPPHEGLLTGQAQVFGAGARGDDEAVAGVGPRIAGQREGPLRQVDRVDVIKHHLGLEPLGVLLKTLHQVGAHDTVDIGRPIVDLGGGHELSALRQTGDQKRLQIGPGRVDGGGVACRAGSENEHARVPSGGGHESTLE